MTRIIALACLAILPIARATEPDTAMETITLRLMPASVPGPELARARAQTAEILRQANVKVIWKLAGRHGEEPAPRDCPGFLPGQAIDISVIDVMIREHTLPTDHRGALAFSRPFARSGVRIVIFYDRVLAATSRSNPILLGHVLAHEVGHVLMGTYSHADSGLMHAHWSGFEMMMMQKHPLQFTPLDLKFIEQRFKDQRAPCPSTISSAVPPTLTR